MLDKEWIFQLYNNKLFLNVYIGSDAAQQIKVN